MQQIKENLWRLNKNQYLKKTKDNYLIIAPIQKDMNESFWKQGNKNYFNLLTGGSWFNLIKIIFIVILIAGISWTYARDTRVCRDLMANFSDKCIEIGQPIYRGVYEEQKLTIPLLTKDNAEESN